MSPSSYARDPTDDCYQETCSSIDRLVVRTNFPAPRGTHSHRTTVDKIIRNPGGEERDANCDPFGADCTTTIGQDNTQAGRRSSSVLPRFRVGLHNTGLLVPSLGAELLQPPDKPRKQPENRGHHHEMKQRHIMPARGGAGCLV